MTPDHGELLYEGKAKRVFATQIPTGAGGVQERRHGLQCPEEAQLDDKGPELPDLGTPVRAAGARGNPNPLPGLAGETWMLVRRVEIIPLEVVLRNIATGSLCRQTPIAEGTAIAPALMDLYYKDDALGDPLLTEARVQLLGVADPARLSAIEQLARRVNAVLQPFFEAINLKLVDFKLELGLASDGTLLLADEISPDTCRFWDRRNSIA